MPDRRDFLKLNLAALGMSAVSGAAWGAEPSQRLDCDIFVVDDLATEARLRRNQFVPQRNLIVATDLFSAWKTDIEPLMQAGAPIIAGVTTGYFAFSLSEVAADYGYAITMSAVMHPRTDLHALHGREQTKLSVFDLNSPQRTHWVMQRNGINFHAGARA